MDKFQAFLGNRWLVFVAAMWVQSCAGIGYLFGSLSPIIKSSLGYNQRQVASLGVAKDLGDSVGFLAGTLSEVLPLWGTLLIGAVQNFVGYGWVWLIVTGRAPTLPLWAVSALPRTHLVFSLPPFYSIPLYSTRTFNEEWLDHCTEHETYRTIMRKSFKHEATIYNLKTLGLMDLKI
ncbi:hypothetical protein Taro_011769 [Colocasia esculenta]|uniref:Nodulin-like domain-containing protein n=1 Tax=Colocasia esculenta TaxID=4460 RepID=A0A843U784_COLES|nr:hypothetical protein [Colocasia esculenta]